MFDKLRWEKVARSSAENEIVTWRAAVPGGWLVSVWADRELRRTGQTRDPDGSNWGGGTTFIPDPLHAWEAIVVAAGKDSTQPDDPNAQGPGPVAQR